VAAEAPQPSIVEDGQAQATRRRAAKFLDVEEAEKEQQMRATARARVTKILAEQQTNASEVFGAL
jgi:predicted subunit of tRNA(5-methylaminomethyl-2-thiouridylate) methyltransferase